MSFAHGDRFYGAVILPVNQSVIELIEHFDSTDRIDVLRARGQEDDIPFYVAVEYARLLGLNPGGEVAGREIPPEKLNEFPQDIRMRQLTKRDIEERGLV